MFLRQYSGAVLILLAVWLAAGSAAAQAVMFGFRLVPPYVIQQHDGRLAGLEYELVMAAAEAGSLQLRPEIAPFGRLTEDFRRGSSQGFVPANIEMALPGCLTETLLVYRNTAFTLRDRRLPIAQISDLAHYDVLAFQNAHQVLGPGMDAVRQGNPRYQEVANQMLQLRALFSGRTDVVIADRRIFRYLMRSPDGGVDTSQAVTEHNLFQPTSYAVAFRDAAHCQAFNTGLARIKRDGAFDAIMQRWDNRAS